MDSKYNLEDTTFLIPARLDSITRLENTLVIVDFLTKNFKTSIKVLEASNRNTGLLQKLLPDGVNYQFIEDHDVVFHRTKYINLLVNSCGTPFVSVWDTDIIIPVPQILKTLELLRENKADFVFPYKDKFLDTSSIIRDLYITHRDVGILDMHKNKMKELYGSSPVGGVFFANRKSYIDTGLENEKFYGWGREDGDRINRWKILGYSIMRVDGPLFHLTHERGNNSEFHSPIQDYVKWAELQRPLMMSKDELREELDLQKGENEY